MHAGDKTCTISSPSAMRRLVQQSQECGVHFERSLSFILKSLYGQKPSFAHATVRRQTSQPDSPAILQPTLHEGRRTIRHIITTWLFCCLRYYSIIIVYIYVLLCIYLCRTVDQLEQADPELQNPEALHHHPAYAYTIHHIMCNNNIDALRARYNCAAKYINILIYYTKLG